MLLNGNPTIYLGPFHRELFLPKYLFVRLYDELFTKKKVKTNLFVVECTDQQETDFEPYMCFPVLQFFNFVERILVNTVLKALSNSINTSN